MTLVTFLDLLMAMLVSGILFNLQKVFSQNCKLEMNMSKIFKLKSNIRSNL